MAGTVQGTTADQSEMSIGEMAVRNYLMMLVEPEKLLDSKLIEELESKIAASDDVLERLKLHSRLNQARLADTDHLREGFIRHAKAWAAQEEIPAGAFRDMGVAEDVLIAAGLLKDNRRPRAAARGKKSVTVGDIGQWVRASTAPFTIAQVNAAIGGSPVTIKKAIDLMVSAGEVTRIGPVQGHTGPGRAPIAYQAS